MVCSFTIPAASCLGINFAVVPLLEHSIKSPGSWLNSAVLTVPTNLFVPVFYGNSGLFLACIISFSKMFHVCVFAYFYLVNWHIGVPHPICDLFLKI